MNILGISGSRHDSSACLIKDKKIFMAIEEERIIRIKHASGRRPFMAINTLLENAHISPSDVNLVSYFLDPSLFNRQVLKYVLFDDPKRYLLHPKNYHTIRFFYRGKRYENDLKDMLRTQGITAPIDYVNHHVAHAASSYYVSGFKDAMVLVIDNMGELDSTSIFYGNGSNLKLIKSQKIPHSLGMLYAAVSEYLGFKPWDEEGKVMALAAYGNPIIPVDKIATIGDGWFKVNKPFQMVQTRNYERCYDKELLRMFGPARQRDEPITQFHKDVAASLQRTVEEVCKNLVSYAHKITGSNKLCVSGGVALNCKTNGELLKLPFVEDIYVPSAPGDNGSSLGAALYSSVFRNGTLPEPLHVAGIGQEFTDSQIKTALELSGLPFYETKDPAKDAADILLKEEMVLWFQGKTEFGPRALGHRSLLALARKEETRDFINSNVKHRELWRPLCPSVLAECANKYFKKLSDGRFMNVAFDATDYAKERIPAVIHIDNNARAQLVYKAESEVFHSLLEIIGQKTGDPVLLNTSFNGRGEPIVNSPSDAITTFQCMPINSMVIGNYVVRKKILDS